MPQWRNSGHPGMEIPKAPHYNLPIRGQPHVGAQVV